MCLNKYDCEFVYSALKSEYKESDNVGFNALSSSRGALLVSPKGSVFSRGQLYESSCFCGHSNQT
ncbi:hypothetical protein VCRA2126O293_140106 [Vibrio crassostreae]|nr:hypothetical protein VCRA2126O293_140106 [Vibrio crassostreae]